MEGIAQEIPALWFNVLDMWPVGWLYTDNVYVDLTVVARRWEQ